MMIKRIWPNIKKYMRYAAVYVVKTLLRFLISTCHVDVQGLALFTHEAKHKKCILMLWHNRLLLLPEILHCYAPQFLYRAVISKSRDGELITMMTESYSEGRTLRVAHNARREALANMINHLKTHGEVLVVTPDGPRGPRYEVKPGVAIAAQEADASVVPMTWSASSSWQLKTWDKLIIPKPFSRLSIVIGEPIALLPVKDPVTHTTTQLQEALLHLDQCACLSVNHWPK